MVLDVTERWKNNTERDAVVVPASKYPHGYASIRSLAQSDVHTIVAVADDSHPITASRYCDEIVTIPPSRELGAYKDALLGLAARPDVRTIVPHRPQGPYLFAKYRDQFDQYVDLAVPSLEMLTRVHDRKRLMDAAAEAGVPAPRTELLDETGDWESDRIVKSRYNLLTDEYVETFGPDESSIVKRVEHLSAGESADVEAIRERMNHTPIVQEYVDGQEYMFGALYDHGEPLATFQHRQIRGDCYTGGGGVYRETVADPELEAAARSLLNTLDWHGLACIEYVRDADTGEFKPIECNPRMWQSLACATRAGAAFPVWYWLQVTGQPELIEPGYETGVGTHYLGGELEHVVSIARERSSLVDTPSLTGRLREILQSCYECPSFDYLHLTDPGPFLRQTHTESTKAIKRRM
ncbi:Predicted ATP-dependent carboligase, ATP-grasp superfamily [Halogranum amylolyticum]|uniref:Predicted ATP-dependent carboligase, ATP-grasp superfamily n=1 Tax=Halogranum amylolyticum TaxID=660520 RepID=A0A1H8WLU3_9EURY|nr:carboxylate--amine ligase [Halogranum amylolyticum]SEP28058.1 Predicted ATP-dependent carboligase, ATP-grasp superfamily [Halogranum amylolyticum]